MRVLVVLLKYKVVYGIFPTEHLAGLGLLSIVPEVDNEV